ncbi:MAG: CoA-binding protein [Bacteroidota bacterium]|nr:CoA-binding protein [Odoribacter sp.]MDP3643307.1 CoA-binding protein [Bacteroidota bacterium]
MNPMIDDFINSKKIAVVGISRSGKKFGNYVCKELKTKGYEIYPIHPEAQEIDGMTCYPDLKSVAAKVDSLWISIPPKKVSAVLEDAAEIGLKNIWLQQGAWSKEVQETIDHLNLPVVSKKCILMYASPVHSFHKFHRTIKSIFGGL